MNTPKVANPVMELCGASPVTCLVFEASVASKESGKTTFLLSGHMNGKVLQWSLTTQRVVSTVEAHSESVLWIACPTSDVRISQGREGSVKMWRFDCGSWTVIGDILAAPFVFCNSCIFDCASHYVLATPVDEGHSISVHHLPLSLTPGEEHPLTACALIRSRPSPCQCSHVLTPSSKQKFGMCMQICGFKLSEDLPRLVVAYESGTIALWDITNKVMLCTVQAFTDSIMSVAVCRGKTDRTFRVFAGSVETAFKSWLVSEDNMTEDRSVSVANAGLGCVAVRSDGRIVCTGGWDGRARVFTAAKLRPLAVLTNHKESIQCVAFAADNRLATGSKDGYITMWDVYANT